MKFFHYSDFSCDTLEPVVGGGRHDGEDDRAVDRPVVWLASQWMRRQGAGPGGIARYQYEVEIDEADLQLHEDRKFADLTAQYNQMFRGGQGEVESLRWFFYEGSLRPATRSVWDGTEYLTDPTFGIAVSE